VPLVVHLTEIRVGKFVERIVIELFVERLYRIVVLAFCPISTAEIVVGEFVVGIDFDLFLKQVIAFLFFRVFR